MKTYIYSFLIFTSTAFCKNYKISGKVIDAQTKKPLIGANVIIAQTTLGSATDINGSYEIKNIEQDKFEIQVQ